MSVELAEPVRCAVRVRPLDEAESGSTEVVRCGEANTVEVSYAESHAKRFTASACYGPSASQSDFFEDAGVRKLVRHSLRGFSSTVMAFGQTGAGKSHTIFGAGGRAGVGPAVGLLPRALSYVFSKINKHATELRFTVAITSIEVHNDRVYDLLREGQAGRSVSLPLRWTPNRGFVVEGLTTTICGTAEQALQLASATAQARRVGAHALNARSNRSHSLTTIYLDACPAPGRTGRKTYGKLTPVNEHTLRCADQASSCA